MGLTHSPLINMPNSRSWESSHAWRPGKFECKYNKATQCIARLQTSTKTWVIFRCWPIILYNQECGIWLTFPVESTTTSLHFAILPNHALEIFWNRIWWATQHPRTFDHLWRVRKMSDNMGRPKKIKINEVNKKAQRAGNPRPFWCARIQKAMCALSPFCCKSVNATRLRYWNTGTPIQ